jgi:hypothetical protein
MSEWKKYSFALSTDVHRVGWLGVWDALVSAAMRRPRYTFTKDLEVSFLAKTDSEHIFAQFQIEMKDRS